MTAPAVARAPASAGIYVSGAVLTLKGGTQIEGGAAAAGTLQIDSTGELESHGGGHARPA